MKKFTGGKRTFGSLYLLKQTMLNDKKYDYYHLVTGSDFFFVSPNRFDEILGRSGNSYIEIFKAVNEVVTSEIAKDLYQRLRSYMWRRNILSNGSYEFLFER